MAVELSETPPEPFSERRNAERENMMAVPAVPTSGSTTNSDIPNYNAIAIDLPTVADATVFESNLDSNKLAIKAQIQFATLCWNMFLAGWNDASTGPLLPRIRQVYQVGFAVVSLIFVLACTGFITGAVLNVPLSARFCFGKIMVMASLLQVLAYSLDAAAPPFPLFLFAFVINGVGQAIQDAQTNGFVACIKDKPESKMGILHAAYGAGALSAPLVATQFAQLRNWSFHYLISFGIALSNTLLLLVVFRFKTQDECLEETGQKRPLAKDEVLEGCETGNDENNSLKRILLHRHVNLIAFFTLIYVGVEVTIGGWTVTYIIEQRNGGPSSGYVSAGFFGGLMIGRVALLWLNEQVGEYRVIFLYSLLAIGLELVVWLVPSLVGDSIAIAFVGLLLGPMYPIIMNQTRRILNPRILTGSIGWIAGFGQAGSALIPFITGTLAERFGIWSLQPLVVAMMGLMTVMWAMVPKGSGKDV